MKVMTKDIGNYIVYSDGRVWSKYKKNWLAQYWDNSGYLRVCINGKSLQLHRFIAKMFIENPNNLPQVDHINNDKTNNNIQNLQWCTLKQNVQKAYKDGIVPARKGTLHGMSKFTEEEARAIKYDYPHLTHTEVAKMYPKCSVVSVSNIRNGKNWTHI